MTTLKNLIATTILVTTFLSANAVKSSKVEMLPATFYKGEIIAIKTLPMVTITPSRSNEDFTKSNIHTKKQTGYTLPMVTIIGNKMDRVYAPAVKYNGTYIATINLPEVEIIGKRKPMAFAAMYRMIKYFTNWV